MKKLFQLLIIPAAICTVINFSCKGKNTGTNQRSKRPNILFVLADDQSFPYASIYKTTGINTPAFDEIAKSGILFTNAFAAAPQCSPSRAAILTGKNIWQLEEAGTHSSYFPKKFQVFTDVLESSGYWIGYTGKPWGPGNWKDAGWKRNPVGPEFNSKKLTPPTKGISNVDYFENFVDFYNQKKDNAPFFFWYGAHEPHRVYEEGSAKRAGKNMDSAFVPGFLPGDSVVKSDIEDYALEIEWFDEQLGKMINFLKQKGEWENTMIVVTSDNGMPFPSAKANLLEYGSHVPLAISWPAKIKDGRTCHDLVSLIDLPPTFLQIAGVKNSFEMTGKSLSDILFDSLQKTDHRQYVLTGRERHTHARPDDLGYPSRAIRTDSFLLIMNLKPDRWPAGNPPPAGEAENNEHQNAGGDGDFKGIGAGYNDIDEPSPTKLLMIKNKNKWPDLFEEGFSKRPAIQLFNIITDPACTKNLANKPEYSSVKNSLEDKLEELLTDQGDPRMLGNGDIFESYPRFGLMRNWPGFKERGKYNPAYQNHKD
jgi:uncharacterized sulfatase